MLECWKLLDRNSWNLCREAARANSCGLIVVWPKFMSIGFMNAWIYEWFFSCNALVYGIISGFLRVSCPDQSQSGGLGFVNPVCRCQMMVPGSRFGRVYGATQRHIEKERAHIMENHNCRRHSRRFLSKVVTHKKPDLWSWENHGRCANDLFLGC